MGHKWKITVWGARGSLPASGVDYAEYGGNTSCISADCGDRMILLDAGSGMTNLGYFLKRSGRKKIDILISHLHMDHCLGLFGFPLFHDPQAEIRLYGAAQEGAGFRQNLENLLRPPYWPLGLENFSARVELHELAPGESFRLAGGEGISDGVTIRTLPGNHPNQSLLYRLEHGGRSIIYALDNELDDETRLSLTDFARGGSLLIWDANFTEEDLSLHRGWGHSTWNQGIALRRSAGAESALMTHFSFGYTDAFLREQERLCTRADPTSRFAKEGMELFL